jgi:hypothetical protein
MKAHLLTHSLFYLLPSHLLFSPFPFLSSSLSFLKFKMAEIQGLTPPDTQPDKATPLPLPPPSTSTPPLPSLQTLRDWLPLYLSKTDASLTRLSSILSTPAGTDNILVTLCYTSLLSSALLSRFSLARLHRAARLIIEKAVSLPANATIIIDTSTIPTSRAAVAAARLKALSSLISDFRIFARLWGLLDIYQWGKRVMLKEEKDVVLKGIAHAQVLVNVFYQYLENGAYLSSKGVMGWDSKRQNRAWLWSSRWWMAHVALDFVRLGREAAMRKNNGEKEEEIAEAEWRETWRKQLVVNLAYAPLTVHWSLEGGLVSDAWVGLLGSVAGLAGLRSRWKDAGK